MDRNLVLAIIISVAIIIVFQYFFQSFSPPPPKQAPVATEKPVGPQKPAKETELGLAKEKPSAVLPEPGKVKAAPEAAAPEKAVSIRVDTPYYEAVLSSRGGKITSFKLKDYKTSLHGDELVNLFESDGVDTAGPSIMFTRRDETFSDSDLGYAVESGNTLVTLTQADEKKSVTFRATTAAGLTIAKTYTFSAGSYLVDFSIAFTNISGEALNYLVTFPWRKVYHGEHGTQFSWNSAEILLNGQLRDYYFKDIKGDEEPSGKVEWAGLGDVYFFKALVFGKTPASKVTLFKPSPEGAAEMWLRYGSVDIPEGKSVNADLGLYLGPKEKQALQSAGHDLPKAQFYSQYLVLEIMSEYLMRFLRLCYTGFQIGGLKIPGTGNYGWSIIILTVLIKILFIPLSHKSMKSMKRMQDLQPQIAKLREKFKDDKAALNKATMELFREHKVNPLGSCWPMLLQIPVFIALYQALSYAIELRHAGFICIPSIYLCINDLSAPDPYYVTPILMGGSMALQQWMTPTGGDPMQRKMMLLMPVVFTYLFLSFPSGLVLYWLVNNVLSIGQQIITNRMAD